MKVLNSLFDA